MQLYVPYLRAGSSEPMPGLQVAEMHDDLLDTGRDNRSQRLPPSNSSYFASFRNHLYLAN